MSFELLDLSENYKYFRLGDSFAEGNIPALFQGINTLSLFLTSKCNLFGCKHCAVNFPLFSENNSTEIIDDQAALALTDLISPALQFTDSGGEVLLLDEQIRQIAYQNQLLSQSQLRELRGVDFLEKLVSKQVDKLVQDYGAINRQYPIYAYSKRERFVRAPTNALLFPWLIHEGLDVENHNLDDEMIRKSRLYEVWSRFPNVLFVVSIGVFQEQEYKRVAANLHSPELTLMRRVKELARTRNVLTSDFGSISHDGKMRTYGLGFIYNYCAADSKTSQLDIANALERIYGEKVAPQHPDENPLYCFATSIPNVRIEREQVVGVQRGFHLPGAFRYPHINKNLAEINELYAVPFNEGIGFYPDTLQMYHPEKENAVFVLGYNKD
ncbi:MAG: hypothetical protein MAG795_00998 [Candidatus Woesearchaeota archaeon]|nr:hypothetical protein [Candidatus Woesearchaeota archaeon]